MRNEQAFNNFGNGIELNLRNMDLNVSRRATIGIILTIALLAFELFNFDTTQYALRNLLGDVQFVGLQWASILAIAFCAIDFAGLARLFTPEKGQEEPKEVWYLMGAWLLGATMNAIMTWWAVSLTLLNNNFGNEVLGRETLLQTVPIFVAVLVWLTRILFIGAFSVTGDHLFNAGNKTVTDAPVRHAQTMPMKAAPKREPNQPRTRANVPVMTKIGDDLPEFLNNNETVPVQKKQMPKRQTNSRIRQRPPMPNGGGIRRPAINGVQARSRNRH